MANLKDLIYGYESGSVTTPGEFMIENNNYWMPQNGGCAYIWTVPAGKTKMVAEIWSGGAGGGHQCCCMMGAGGAGGGYQKIYATITPGAQICMCSAGTTGSGNNGAHSGCHGCSSYMCSNTDNWCTCVNGGPQISRNVRCFMGGNCYSCCSTCYCCEGREQISGSNICVLNSQAATQTTHQATQWCYDMSWQYMGGNYGVPGQRPQGTSSCCQSCWGGICSGYSSCCGQACLFAAHHPGGGGQSAWGADGGCRCGSPGAGGLIYVVYW